MNTKASNRHDRMADSIAAAIGATQRSTMATLSVPSLTLPRVYGSLVARYDFAAFDWGPVHFFGTVGEDELFPAAAFADRHLVSALTPKNFVQIGKPKDGSYDPVCLECRGERLVRIDHEKALMHGKVHLVEGLAKSFSAFIEQHLSGHLLEK